MQTTLHQTCGLAHKLFLLSYLRVIASVDDPTMHLRLQSGFGGFTGMV